MARSEAWVQSWRLSALSAGVALLAVFVLLAGQVWFAEREEVIQDLEVKARIVGANAGVALAFKDADTASEVLAALAHSSMISNADLYLPDGQVLATFTRPGSPGIADTLPQSVRGAAEVRVATPVILQGRSVGTIAVKAELSRVYSALAGFFLAFMAAGGVAGVVAYLAGRGIRHRLAENQFELESSRATIRLLGAHRENVVEGEHKRIAREIHDELGQVLTTALMNLKGVDRALRAGEGVARERIAEIRSCVESALEGVKGIATDLRPPVLNIGLPAAIEWLTERTLTGSGVTAHIEIDEFLPDMGDRCAIALFRVVQESLTNVVRHARAHSVSIDIGRDGEDVRLDVKDDGVGFSPSQEPSPRCFGLLGIRERIAALGGRTEIRSSYGTGTKVSVWIPSSAFRES